MKKKRKNMQKEHRTFSFRIFPWITMALATMACGWLLLSGYNDDFFYRAQEHSLFLPTRLFYDTLAIYPGGTLSWAAAFLTQFFYYPALGVTILLCLWIAVMAVTRKVFRTPDRWSVLLLTAPCALLAAILQNGYFLFYCKLPGHLFVPTLGYLTALLAAWLYRTLPPRNGIRTGWMIVWACIGYPLFGAYSFIGTACMMMLGYYLNADRFWGRLKPVLTGLLLIGLVPLIAYLFYSQTNIDMLYRAALPCFSIGEETFYQFRIPYVLLILAPLLCLAVYERRVPVLRTWQCITLQTVALGVFIAFVNHFRYNDANFGRELCMYRATEELDWEKVVDIARHCDETPTRPQVMNKNLALFRLGRAGDEMFRFRDGSSIPNAPFGVKLTQINAKQMYFHYGKANFCYRWCMEDCVETGWKVESLKFMAKTSLLNQEYDVARKYLNLLKKTLFHKDWAAHYETFLQHPDRMREDPEFGPILHLMCFKNGLDSDNSVVELYLMNSFAKSFKEDPLFEEQSVLSALVLKNIDLFWEHFFRYAAQHTNDPHMPTHFQEAAYLYGHLEDKVDISNMPFDQEVKQSYEAMMERTRQCAGMSEDQLAQVLYPRFGHTFYYYYFLYRNVKTY
ncbi:MAG: DUF456 domain-containing protein [Paraprevotella sp.]|nr:DUF456 domain-containing protein [Paraprevotella sp.]